MQFNALHKPNQVFSGTGNTAIVTGWLPKEKVLKQLDSSAYAVIGQLYSAATGINFIIRNLLWNPHVTRIILIAATREDKNAGSCQCLKDLFEKGFTDNGKNWKVSSRIVGLIDKEIPTEVLSKFVDKFKSNIFWFDNAQDAITFIKNNPQHANFCDDEKLSFPIPEIMHSTTPSQIIGHRVTGQTIAETWLKIIARIRQNGVLRPTGYDGQWQELIDLVSVVEAEPDGFYFPEPNYLPVDKEFIANYLPQMCDDAEYVEGVKYRYGQRMRSWFGVDQIEEVIAKLIAEIDSASAVINLWDSGGNALRRADKSSDHQHGGSPCLNHIWVRVVNGKLTLTATFRSNDMFSAWVSNAMGLRALQQHICTEINARSSYQLLMGELVTISQSAHIYDNCFAFADDTISKVLGNKQDYNDPVGNFVIQIVEGSIEVKQTGDAGDIAIYTGTKAIKLMREIVAKNPSIEAAHIGYLGIELALAEAALKAGTQYNQDKM